MLIYDKNFDTISGSLGITEERKTEMEDTINDAISQIIKDSRDKGNSSVTIGTDDIMEVIKDIPRNANESFMLGIMYIEMKEQLDKIHNKSSELEQIINDYKNQIKGDD
jgi:hypothetical protein